MQDVLSQVAWRHYTSTPSPKINGPNCPPHHLSLAAEPPSSPWNTISSASADSTDPNSADKSISTVSTTMNGLPVPSHPVPETVLLRILSRIQWIRGKLF